MAKVIVGMSGGVDSAVAAYLLKKAGHDVIGVTLRTWEASDGENSRCCEIDDARSVAHLIDIPFYAFNCTSDFVKKVIGPFVSAYVSGQTPNPCIPCNRYVKWERMLYAAQVLQADYVATGHYASVVRLDNGRYTVKKAKHAQKDQTYMLYRLTQQQLAATLMPLGELSKQEVREIAAQAGLPVAGKKDSQEICFVPDGSYASFIEDYLRKGTDTRQSAASGEAAASAASGEGAASAALGERSASAASGEAAPLSLPPEGFFVDEEGNRLGRHKGIIHYTIGQRKGLGLAMGHPVFVKEIRPDSNEVVISEEDALFSSRILCGDVNYMGVPDLREGESLRCMAKVRYHHSPQEAVVEAIGPDQGMVSFKEPVRAPAPGQSAVFYDDNDCVIGGGYIL